MQAPAAPASLTEAILAEVIPPMAYTGTGTQVQSSFRKGIPLPGSPFLQSVSKICPAVM